MTGIKSIATYYPKNWMNNEELAKKFGYTVSFLLEKVGVVTRAIADAEETTSDMCCSAAQLLFEKNPQLNPSIVDLLIVCTQNPDYKIPHTSAILQDRLNLRTSSAAFDISLGCSGYIYSLAVCKSMIETLGFKNVLLFTADPYSKILDPEDPSTALLFSDAATATWLSNDADNCLGQFSFGTDGSGAESLMIRGGGVKFPFWSKGKDFLLDKLEDPFLRMDGRKICKFMKRTVPQDVMNCLAKNRVSIDEIDYFVFHQASKYIIDSLRKQLNLDESKVVFQMMHSGNTVSSSIPGALQTVLEKDEGRRKIVLSGFGVGLSWGSCLLY